MTAPTRDRLARVLGVSRAVVGVGALVRPQLVRRCLGGEGATGDTVARLFAIREVAVAAAALQRDPAGRRVGLAWGVVVDSVDVVSVVWGSRHDVNGRCGADRWRGPVCGRRCVHPHPLRTSPGGRSRLTIRGPPSLSPAADWQAFRARSDTAFNELVVLRNAPLCRAAECAGAAEPTRPKRPRDRPHLSRFQASDAPVQAGGTERNGNAEGNRSENRSRGGGCRRGGGNRRGDTAERERNCSSGEGLDEGGEHGAEPLTEVGEQRREAATHIIVHCTGPCAPGPARSKRPVGLAAGSPSDHCRDPAVVRRDDDHR